MKHTRGAADPLAARRILIERLSNRLASDGPPTRP
jgi:hypothetical protein